METKCAYATNQEDAVPKIQKSVSDHRADAKSIQDASGVPEDKSERTKLLEDIIKEFDDASRKKRARNQQKKQYDHERKEAGEWILLLAVIRQSNDCAEHNNTENGVEENAVTFSRQRCRRDAFFSDNDQMELVFGRMEARKMPEEK